MSNSRRDFLKKNLLAGAAAIAAPGIGLASVNDNNDLPHERAGKTFQFPGRFDNGWRPKL